MIGSQSQNPKCIPLMNCVPGAGVRRSGLDAITSNTPIRLNAQVFASPTSLRQPSLPTNCAGTSVEASEPLDNLFVF